MAMIEPASHGCVLSQFVDIDEDTRFPVTADPQFTRGLLSAAGPLALAACAAAAGLLVAAANIAKINGECVKVKFSGTPATPVYLGAYTYRGGYCT